MKKNKRSIIKSRQESIRISSKKITDRLTYEPLKQKQKSRRKMREKLASRKPVPKAPTPPPKTSLDVGAININGLDFESQWAVEQILIKHNLDVSNIKKTLKQTQTQTCSNYRF